MQTRVIVNGAKGKMGRITATTLENQNDIHLVAKISHEDDLAKTIQNNKADIVIDFTLPHCVFQNCRTIIENGARPVVGTSGLTSEQILFLQDRCHEKNLGGIIAPNFSIGAILMMRYAQDAAKYLADVEIIEMHHAQKVDAPSGTAKKTAEMITAVTQKHNLSVHSVRLPGLFATQMVIFGGMGETLTIKHEAIDRNAMMPGVLLACRKVMELKHLVYGLENLITPA